MKFRNENQPLLNGTLKMLLIFLLFICSSVISVLAARILKYNIDSLTSGQELIITFITDLVLVIILAAAYFKDLIKEFKIFKSDYKNNIEIAVKYWLVGLIAMVVTNVIIGLFTSAQATNENAVQKIIESSKYISLFTIGILAPIIEELVFRKAFREAFKNDLLFILTSSLVFGSLHVVYSLNSLWDLLYIIPYSSLGIAFAVMYCKSKSIYTSMLMHMFHNTVLTLLSLVSLGVIL